MKKYNFSAGPSILSDFTIKETAKAVLDFYGTGLSLLEVSHRDKEFDSVMNETVALFKELLDIPKGYEVLFLGGGASMQFCMIPYNILNRKASYLDTGTWASKAIKEAKLFGEVEVVASSKEANYNYYPHDYKLSSDSDYFHITTNNTIFGTAIHEDLSIEIPLVADMSSDIFSRPVDISKYGIIYGGAQKNLAPAGLTFVIVKEDLLGKVERSIPTMLDYKTHIKANSMFNTPPVLPIYSALQTLKFYKTQGGVNAMARYNKEKAALLYNAIDSSKMFQSTVANEKDRSIMNVTFVLKPAYQELEKDFFEKATNKGISGIKGHRSVGGFRASIYNAMTKEGINALIEVMNEFEKNN